MKTPQDKLYRLIQAMAPAEKRYFKRHYAIGKNNLIDLFEFLNTLPAYDEAKVKAHFSHKVSKHLKVYKIQLQELLLKSLLSYRSKKDLISKIRIGLEETEMLIGKGLHDFALERLLKTKQLCVEHEMFTYSFEIIRLEYQLTHVHIDNTGLSKLPLFTELKEGLDHLQQEYDLFMLSQQLNDMLRAGDHRDRSDHQTAELQEKLNSALFRKKPDQLSFRARVSRNICLMMIHKMLGNEELDHQYRNANVELFRKRPEFIQVLPFTYIGCLRNYLNYIVQSPNLAETKAVIQEAEACIQKYPVYNNQLIYFYYGELHTRYILGEFESLIGEPEEKAIRCIQKTNIEKERIALLCYLILSIAHLLAKKLSAAHKYLRLAQQVPPDIRGYFEELLLLLEMICHYEAKQPFLIENQLTAWSRRKKEKDEPPGPFLTKMLKLFKLLAGSKQEARPLAGKLYRQMGHFAEDRVTFLFQYYHLENWLLALSENQDFARVLKKKIPAV